MNGREDDANSTLKKLVMDISSSNGTRKIELIKDYLSKFGHFERHGQKINSLYAEISKGYVQVLRKLEGDIESSRSIIG